MKAAQFIIMSLLASGCVSVNLGPKKPEKASGVVYTPPTAPFQKTSSDVVDAIWRDPRNGNAISYLSDCSDTSDPPLSSIETGVLSGLFPYEYTKQKDLVFLSRAARRVQVRGQVDGVPSLVDLLILKRNSCIYVLSYAGVEEHHPEGQRSFESFVEGFRAP